MEQRESVIRLPDELIDQNGQAKFTDDWGTGWLEMPPTPPPKSPRFGGPSQPSSSRSFLFPPKDKFASLVSLCQNSTSGLLRSAGSSTLVVPESKRQSADNSESSRDLFYSSSSTHSGKVRKRKSSFNLISKLRPCSSKPHLRSESKDSEHPSLRPPVPPLSHRYNNLLAGLVTDVSTPTVDSAIGKGKRDKGKKKASQKVPPTPPPKFDGGQEYTGDLNLEHMDGIVDFSIASAGITPSLSSVTGISTMRDPSSPSSGVNSAQSYSDHSSYQHHNQCYISRSEFSNPFSTMPLQDKRKGIIPAGDYRKVSPKSLMPPPPPNSAIRADGGIAGPSSGPGSATWVPPESWAVEKGADDPYNIAEMSETHDSGSEDSILNDPYPINGTERKLEDRMGRRLKNPASASFSSTISSSRGSLGTLRGLPNQPPPGFSYKMRIYRQNHSYHVISIELDTTVGSLIAKLNKKGTPEDDRLQHNLYLKEQSRERMLGQNERPAAIVKLRMEQAGYDLEDSLHLLSAESLGILLRFVFKSQLLAGEEQIDFDNYDYVDLSGQGLRTIPPIVHQNAEHIVSLILSRNPMIEIPLDFIQSCTTLQDLCLTHMSMKKVPQSLRHSATLHRLDISCNSIRDLEEAYLDHIHDLLILHAQNNRLENLPWHFARLRSLHTINISNNKFRKFPIILTQVETLRALDISFNMITELPEDIGKMKSLERLIIVGNQVSKFPDQAAELVSLRMLDIRRNQISDLTLICRLPQIHTVSADHNSVYALDIALGPNMHTLIASHNDITQLSLVPGPMGNPPYALAELDLSYAKLSSIDDLALSHLSSLRKLKLDHNSIRSIPESLGGLTLLESFSCTDNKLDTLPSTIGNLQKLEFLDAHNNNLNELPQTLWNCASLTKINVTSNFLNAWHGPPAAVVVQETPVVIDGSLAAPVAVARKPSMSSINSARNLPPLVHSLEKLYVGENYLADNAILPLMLFKELRILNISYNEIQDMPGNFFRNMSHLEELYLSGNKLTSMPVEDFPRLTRLSILFLNGNKLQTLPQELGKVATLKVLDVGSNYLKYNINNWEFDWNWNFNTNLEYLNLSGNKRLQIKPDSTSSTGTSRHFHSHYAPMLSGFTSLSRLKVLGLMDVTITTTAHDTTVDIPDENADRRVRTSLSTVCGMGYGIADSLGNNDHLNMLDLVHEFHGRKNEAIVAMFGRTHPPRGLKPGSSPNRLSKYLHDNFVNVFSTQLVVIKDRQEKEGIPQQLRKEGIPKALHWTFLKLNQDLCETLLLGARKDSMAGLTPQNISDMQHSHTGVSGVALYFFDKTIYAANVGDTMAVVSRQGVCHEISRKHDPYDRLETARIRAAEGSISPPGLVNDEVEVSRAFGYYHLFPPMNARPDIFVYDLTDMDEFVIIANRGLWDFVSYQTAVDIARTVFKRTERPDAMLAAQKLRDFAISYGADGSTMIMVIWVADLFTSPSRSRQPTLDPIVEPQQYRPRRKDEEREKDTKYLDREIAPPTGHVTLVFTDIRNSTHLWEANPGMPTAMRLHNTLLRRQLRFCGGYEVKTEGDSFMCSFPTTLAAVRWCLTTQVQLLHESWPLEILECEDGMPIYDSDGRLIARGLSVRMGIHSGTPLCEPDLLTRRMDYIGPMVNRSARIESSALGGQIMCSMDIIHEINAKVLGVDEETEYSKLQNPAAVDAIRELGVVIMLVGEVRLKGIELPEILSLIYPSGLEGRHDLKEAPADPTASASRVQFSVPQIRELGMLCLRMEALSSGRIFQQFPERKASIQSNNKLEEHSDTSRIFYGDPNLLLPPINDHSTDSDLMIVLDSLSLRIENAVSGISKHYGIAPPMPSAPLTESLEAIPDT
ncbi:hypothetical protein BDZ97DRAFT_1918661 [Flammula alnicola]|nr:hypothetical protein BDZ97DRAFT_1918661 [Flammula alnicola]